MISPGWKFRHAAQTTLTVETGKFLTPQIMRQIN